MKLRLRKTAEGWCVSGINVVTGQPVKTYFTNAPWDVAWRFTWIVARQQREALAQ